MEPPTVREVTRMLEKEGFKFVSQKGSHCKYSRDGRYVTISGHPGKHLKWKTWYSIKKQAGL